MFNILPTIETVDSQAKLSRLLLILDFTIKLFWHQLPRYIDSLMYRKHYYLL